MNPTTKSKFAAMIGVTPQYMPKIEYQLSMVSVPGKKKQQVDLHGALTLKYLADREIQISESEPTPPPAIKKTSALTTPRETLIDTESKRELEKLKIKEQTEQIKIKNEMVRGDLVSKLLITATHNQLAAIDENQFKSLNVSVSPKINAVYTRANSVAVDKILALIGKKKDHELKTDLGKILNVGSEDRKKEIDEIIEDATGNVLKNIQREFDICLKRMEKNK